MSQAFRPTQTGGLPLVVTVSTRLDREGFGVRFVASRRRLWWVAVSILGRRESADDVLQEAALIGLTKLDEFDSSTSFDAWMAQIVRFVALNVARKAQRRSSHHERHASDLHAAHGQDSAEIDIAEVLRHDDGTFDDRTLRALMALPEQPRTCLLLRVLEDLSYREIAGMLCIPEGTAMSHVYRARTSLRRTLERETDS
ncbi:MAG: RNA polymerase sigma factor [Phycisphaeraceae bacterium]|nr:RNA polymerase sigma factor [Phycisphaeraceae bacterium]